MFNDLTGLTTEQPYLHHHGHPQLAQDPVTGQTLVISSISGPLHAQQLGEIIRYRTSLVEYY